MVTGKRSVAAAVAVVVVALGGVALTLVLGGDDGPPYCTDPATVLLPPDAERAQIDAMEDLLRATAGIEHLTPISKQQYLEDAREGFEETDPVAADLLRVEDMPPSFRLSADDGVLAELRDEIESREDQVFVRRYTFDCPAPDDPDD